MRVFTLSIIVLLTTLTAYSIGQNNLREPNPCCCPHMKQLADDVHWLRGKLSKPYVPPPDVEPIGPLEDNSKLPPVEPIKTFKINTPKRKN